MDEHSPAVPEHCHEPLQPPLPQEFPSSALPPGELHTPLQQNCPDPLQFGPFVPVRLVHDAAKAALQAVHVVVHSVKSPEPRPWQEPLVHCEHGPEQPGPFAAVTF